MVREQENRKQSFYITVIIQLNLPPSSIYTPPSYEGCSYFNA